MEQLAGATRAIRKPHDKAGVELALSKSQRVHSLRTFGLDWYLHPDVRQHIPLDIYLHQDAEFNDQIRQLYKEGGPQIGTACATVAPTCPANIATRSVQLPLL